MVILAWHPCGQGPLAYTWQDCFGRGSLQQGEDPPLRTRGIIDPPIGAVIVVWCLACSTVDRLVGSLNLPCTGALWICLVPEHFDFPPVVHDWVNKGLGMSSCVCATGHIKDPVPLLEKSRASCPNGRFASSFIHQVIIITWLNKLYDRMFSPWRWP